MDLFERSMFAEEDDEAGVFIDMLGRALVTWAAMQNKPVTVADAALAFNTTPDVIREAVEEASWIYVSGEGLEAMLELDGT